MVTTKLNLSMTEPQVRQIYAKQGDTGRVLDITLDQTPEDGTLRILRPDGVEVTSEAVTGGEISESGETVTFESMTEADVTELTVGIEPVQDLSHGDPSPSNICPITGHDEVRVYDDPVYGKTIKWNQLIKNGNFADASNWSWWISGMTVTVSGNVATATTPGQWNSMQQTFDWTYGHVMLARASVKKFGESGNIRVKVANDFGYTNNDFSETISANDVWTDVVMRGKYTTTPSGSTAQVQFGVQEYRPSNSNNGFQIKNVGVFDLTEMFGEGNEPTIEEFEALFPKDYYPYNTGEETTVSAVNGDPNRQYTTSLGQTVYGGTLDMVTGVLTVDKAMVSLSGSDLNIGSGTTKEVNMWRLPLNNPYGTLASSYPSGISNKYVLRNSYNEVNNNNGSVGLNQVNGSQILIRDDSLTTAQEVIDAFNSTPLTFVYPLATPQTYQLTAQQIKTLVGTNNAWASSGDIVNIKFTYGGMLSELPSDATSIVGKCYCDVEQNGVSSMPFTLNVKKNERAT